ncbi:MULTISPECIES: YbdD/YjiX family protein [unclassified Microbacterium]|uniref:YbdD/YjiX family protein n=1 Tax=unclassified Microbacterium TaxID=2609290 RepID=UPI0012F89D33|nr:YbdD/YjiX family protein [Microbacterium sp. MAH-37]MVQ40586.1 putative selenoprotein [Microbacterium sp. MAH-37]
MSVDGRGLPSASATFGRRVRAALASVRWYVTALMGDRAYADFVAHQRRNHPGADIPTEREFWCDRMAEQDRNPGARCC